MTSKLEDVLLRDHKPDAKVRNILFDYLDDRISLYALRQCSRPLKDVLDHQHARLWRNLYMHSPLRPNDLVPPLEKKAPFCQHLTISIGFDKTATNRRASRIKRASRIFKHFPGAQKLFSRRKTADKSAGAQSSIATGTDDNSDHPYLTELPSKDHSAIERLIWSTIFRTFTHLTTLTLRVNGHPAWRGRDEPEATLLLLRLCLEATNLRSLRQINLHPIHGMGILHLRWGGFGAISEIPTVGGLRLWQGITSLSLRVRNPAAREGEVYGKQYITFLKIFNDYLRSFSRNLQTFKLVWLDREGPNPLALDLEPEMEEQTQLQWPILEEFWFGNVQHPNAALALVPDRAPGINIVKVLRSTHQDSILKFEDEGAWITISQSRIESMHAERIAASSVYSQSPSGTPRAFEGPAVTGDVVEVEDYNPEDYSPVNTRRGRPLNRKDLATSSVYPESQVEFDPPWSLADIGEDEAYPDDAEQDAAVRRGRLNPLIDRRMLATSSVYPQSQAETEMEWDSTTIPSTLEPIDELQPATLNVVRERDLDQAVVPMGNMTWKEV